MLKNKLRQLWIKSLFFSPFVYKTKKKGYCHSYNLLLEETFKTKKPDQMFFSNMDIICILLPSYCEYLPPCAFSFFLSTKKLLQLVQRDLFPFAKAWEMYYNIFFPSGT